MIGTANKLSLAARERVRARLLERVAISPGKWIPADLLRSDPDEVTALATRLAALIGVPAGHLRAEDKFREILRVHREELLPEIQSLMAEAGLVDVIDPFAFALLDFVEKRVGEDPSRLQHFTFQPSPSNEGQWLERILELSVGELLRALL
jgi:hypothetical protein